MKYPTSFFPSQIGHKYNKTSKQQKQPNKKDIPME